MAAVSIAATEVGPSTMGAFVEKAGVVGSAAISRVFVGLSVLTASQELGGGVDMLPPIPADNLEKRPEIMMGKKPAVVPQTKEKDVTCTASNPNCKNEALHRGNIQAQEEKGMLVLSPAISIWNAPAAPGYTFAVTAATAVRMALLAQKGMKLTVKDGVVPGDRGTSFQGGADKAHATLLKILENSKQAGIFSKYEVSCYFDGKKFFGANKSYKKLASRRIDLTVHKGQLMGPGTI